MERIQDRRLDRFIIHQSHPTSMTRRNQLSLEEVVSKNDFSGPHRVGGVGVGKKFATLVQCSSGKD